MIAQMHTITLYRIRRSGNSSAPYKVGETYKIHTDVNIDIPENLKLDGVALSNPFIPWFENTIAKIMEQHMGGEMIDKWAVPNAEDPMHVTIAVGVNGQLVYPDLLMNTTNYSNLPLVHKQIVYMIRDAIKKKDPNFRNKALVFSPEWEQKAYDAFFKKHHPKAGASHIPTHPQN